MMGGASQAMERLRYALDGSCGDKSRGVAPGDGEIWVGMAEDEVGRLRGVWQA